MKKNRKLIILGVIITLLYTCLVAFYLWNINNVPEQYTQVESEIIEKITKEIEGALNEYPINPSKLKSLTQTYPVDYMVMDKDKIVYTSGEGFNDENFFTTANANVILKTSHGTINSNGRNYEVLMRVYQMPDDAFVMPFLKKQILILGVSFALLIAGLFLLIMNILNPLKRIKKSIDHLGNYEFDKIEKGTDVINKRFSDVTTKLEDNIDTISKEYSNFERELETSRQYLNNTLIVSKSFIHDLKTPINQQHMMNEVIRDHMDEKQYTIEEIADINMKQSENLILRVNEILKILNQDMTRIEEKSETFDLVALTYETLQYFSELFAVKALDVDVIADEKSEMYANYVIVQLLIHNLLSNIANYAKEKSTVSISIDEDDKSVIMTYSNFSSKENIKRMKKSEMLFNAEIKETYRKEHRFSSRNGLFLIKDLTELSKGTYALETKKDEVIITIHIPKKEGIVL